MLNQSSLMSKERKPSGNRFQILSHDQVIRLHEVMEADISLHSRAPNCPTIRLKLKDLVRTVRECLAEEDVEVRDVRLNGGAATYVIGTDQTFTYSDIDLLFAVDLSTHSSTMQKVKCAVLDSLMSFLPAHHDYMFTASTVGCHMSLCSLKESYIQKLVRICNPGADFWSLIALGNPAASSAKTVELKFVDRMRRQFEFTVDSFQIILDSLLTFYDVSDQPMSLHFYPTVVAEAMSGNFQEAVYHLRHRLISTNKPEEIRGGGLLKYCKLLVDGYQPADTMDIQYLERYMCSRFFIDFPDLPTQLQKLEAYLMNHFGTTSEVKVDYLRVLHRVVANSTVCLMNYDRYQTLALIDFLVQRVLSEMDTRQSVVQLEAFNSDNWVVDRVFYGTSYFPTGYVKSVESSANSSNTSTPMDLTPVEAPTELFPTLAS